MKQSLFVMIIDEWLGTTVELTLNMSELVKGT
jgi:hypothetical protein